MIINIRILTLVATIFLFSCSNSEDKSQQDNGAVSISKIENLESELFNSEVVNLNTKKALKLGKLYVEYASAYPNDTVAPEFLYKAADISMNVGRPQLTIVLFEKIIENYPNYKNIPTIMFLMGYVYENELNDYEKAGNYYIEFLDKYPDSDFADDATISLKNLGKSPEEMIEEFENNTK
jgi:outer membrane protein assembly factor BamD (BamD/ComL family)